MKYIFFVLLLAGVLAMAQQSAAPVTTVAPTTAQAAQILRAEEKREAAQLAVVSAQWASQTAERSLTDQLAAVKKALGLDDTWSFNFQTGLYVKVPPPAAPAPAAAKEPAKP